ncbi:MAG: hypothetical protein AAF215_35075 [Cyanobacteria bacterium P01_A01_bin.123]
METFNLLLWIGVIGGLFAFATWAMITAYVRPPKQAIAFLAPIEALTLPLSGDAHQAFQAGCEAFRGRQYRNAIDDFTTAIAQAPDCGEAYHNRGRVQANLKQDNLAVKDLLDAGDRYDQQGTKAALDQVKQDLELIASRSRK